MNKPDPATGGKITTNKLSGNSTFTFDCNSFFNGGNAGSGVVAWYPTIGS